MHPDPIQGRAKKPEWYYLACFGTELKGKNICDPSCLGLTYFWEVTEAVN